MGAYPDHLVGGQRLGGTAHRHHLRAGEGRDPDGRGPRCSPTWPRLKNGTPIAANPYAQAVTAGWIIAGTGADQQIQQWEFDRGVLRVMGLMPQVKLIGHLQTADEWRPPLPFAFGIEQAVRALGARVNAPDGSDAWETWPRTPMRRLNLAVEAYALGHLAPELRHEHVTAKIAVATRAAGLVAARAARCLGMALQYAGAPVRVGR